MTPRYVETANSAQKILLHVFDDRWCGFECPAWTRDQTHANYRYVCLYFRAELRKETVNVENPQPGDPVSFTGCARCAECVANEIQLPSVCEIKNAIDCEVAIARLEQIWDAYKRPGSPEFEERARLIDAIEKYEDEHVDWPDET